MHSMRSWALWCVGAQLAALAASASGSSTRQLQQAFPAGTSVRLSTTNPGDGSSYCLEINPYAGNSSGSLSPGARARSAGAIVDVWACNAVETGADFMNRDIIDHWMLTARSSAAFGQIRSWVSGQCVAVDDSQPSGLQVQTAACSTMSDPAAGQWQFANGQFVLSQGGGSLCLAPDWSRPRSSPIQGRGFPLVVSHCASVNATWSAAANGLVTYPVPDLSWMAAYPYKYDVSVQSMAGGVVHRAYTYISKPHYNGSSTQFGKSLSWTTFAFDPAVVGPVRVTVRATSSWKVCVVTPKSLGIQCEPAGDGFGASFVVPQAMTKVSVEFDPASPSDPSSATNVVQDALLVFADPIEDPIPDPNDPSVTYFGPGEHVVNCLTLQANTITYLFGGAFLVGAMQTEAGTNNVTILGRGVLTLDDQRDANHQSCPYRDGGKKPPGLVFLCGGLDLRVDGITAVATPECVGGHIGGNLYFDQCNVDPAWGQGMQVTNVKVMGWSVGADGINVGRRGYVADSFSRTNDDNCADPVSHQLWERNTFWQLANGWPFMIQWNTQDSFQPDGGATNITVRDQIIVHVEQDDTHDPYGGPYRSVFGAWQGEPAPNAVTDVTFSNVHVEGGLYVRLFMMTVRPSRFSKDPGICCGSGSLSDIEFSGVTSEFWPSVDSWLEGNVTQKGYISNVHFDALNIAGKHVLSPEGMNMIVDTKSVFGVTFT